MKCHQVKEKVGLAAAPAATTKQIGTLSRLATRTLILAPARIAIRFATTAVVFAAVAAPSNAEETRLAPPAARIDVVLDSDMYNEVDDQFALVYALQSAHRINLQAVCAAPFLNHRSKSAEDGMEQSYQETLRLLNLLEHSGHEFAFRGSNRFLPDRNTAVDSPAAQRIIELAKQDREGPLYVVGLGAATNIASALLLDPSIAERIVVVWIGGHPHHWSHARDFNLKQDVAAAQILFDCGVPLIHIPAGDVAASLSITLPELETGLTGHSPIATKLYDNVDRYYTETGVNRKHPRSGPDAWKKVIWDIATIAWLVSPEKLVETKVVPSPVLADDGTWRQADDRHAIRVAVRLDRDAVYRDLFTRLRKPYLPSPVIERVEFDWTTHRRLAEGSDNWPTTWADDGNLYTAWGDGGGFGGSNSEGRVTLGVARVEGNASDYVGTNVWGGYQPEHPAQFGGKSYGIISVGGVLYLWVVPQPGPHLRECRLAHSTDHGATWKQAGWAFRYEDGLTIPTFLNFGRDNAGARDEFVYSYFIEPTWGPKTPQKSKYGFEVHRPGRIYLARVSEDAILDRDRYEFFAGLDESLEPRWSTIVSDKHPAFRDENGVGWNVSVSFNAGLNRYLLATEHTATHAGKFGLFDAPEPWGPWTVVTYDEDWGKGHVEVSTFYWNFPGNWWSNDGRRATIVFTGKNSNDSWNTVVGNFVRRPSRQPRAASGPLRVHPDNPRYFCNSEGQAVLLTGAHTWNNLVDMGRSDPPEPFDFPAYLDFLDRHGHNFIRLWTWDSVTWDTRANRGLGKDFVHVVAPHPWKRVGPEKALDGKPKFDLKQFDPKYFQRLRSRVSQAGRRGIYVSVMLFEGWGLMHANRGRAAPAGWAWRGHPFHPANNVNGVDAGVKGDPDNGRPHSLGNSAVKAVQAAYIRKVVDTVNDLDNVLYEVINEGGERKWDWWVVETLREYERNKPKQHPIGITGHGAEDLKSMLASSADWISPGSRDGFKDDPPAWDGSKVSLLDTDHVWGIGGNQRWVWKAFLRGHNPLFMDPYNGAVLGKRSDPRWEPIYRSMGYVQQLSKRVDLSELTPHDELASTKYCLADPGNEYLVYVPAGAKASVDLRHTKVKLSAEWLDCATGKSQSAGNVDGGMWRQVKSPLDSDAVLHLRRLR